MGIVLDKVYFRDNKPDYLPNGNEKPSFDPEYGFPAPRKQRVMKISDQELDALQVEKKYRDYCSHLIKDLLICKRDYAPLYGMCAPEFRAYEHCEYEDYVLRMKEYEREKRLRLRALRKEGKLPSTSGGVEVSAKC